MSWQPPIAQIGRADPTGMGAGLVAQWSMRTRPGGNLPWPWVVMYAFARELWTCFLLGPEGARVTAGYGEWATYDRPRKTSITEWKKQRNLELTIDALYNGFAQGIEIENEIGKLETLAETPSGAEDPTVKLFGPVPRIGAKRWVITDLEWGDFIRHHETGTGARLRQQVTIKLLEYVAPANILPTPPPATTRLYKLQRGDNLQKIAQKMLGKASRWKEIEKLNKGMRGIKINTKLFPAGKNITIPAK